MQEKIGFPSKPRISNACKSLIVRILTPPRYRPTLAVIKNDNWLLETEFSEVCRIKIRFFIRRFKFSNYSHLIHLQESSSDIAAKLVSEEIPETEMEKPKLITKISLVENAQCMTSSMGSEITIAKVGPEHSLATTDPESKC